jgi:hypothetical protein
MEGRIRSSWLWSGIDARRSTRQPRVLSPFVYLRSEPDVTAKSV